MKTRTFIKFGGSVITDKTGQERADAAVIQQLAGELATACAAAPDLRVIVGHGSGSFGHSYAQRYGVHRGIAPQGNWMGFAHTAAAALRLNRIVIDALLAAGLPALALQPSTTLRSSNGNVVGWDTTTVMRTLNHGMLPVIHGDVAFDDRQGAAIISTEQLLSYLALEVPELQPTRIILVGEAGVFTADPHTNPQAHRIAWISRENIATVLHTAGASRGADVTGGMQSKVALMWQLVERIPGLTVHLIGPAPDLLTRALLGQAHGEGTTIALDHP